MRDRMHSLSASVVRKCRSESPRPVRGFTVEHVAQSIGNNKWNWSVFLKGDRQDIAQIKCVEYKLHRTFPNPVRRVCDIGDSMRPFALSATGWGTFTIPIRVFMKDGTHQDLQHELKF